MKAITIIVISVIITALVAALIGTALYNKLVFGVLEINDAESFRDVVVCQEIVKYLRQNNKAETGSSTSDNNTETNVEAVIPNVGAPDSDIKVDDYGNVIYEDSYVKVTYVKQEPSIFGPTIKFLIESKSSKTVDISFTDVHIDGFMADTCGAYVSDLKEDKKSFETIYIYESDYEDFTDYPSMIEFTIEVQDSETWADLAESDTIYINIEQ